MPIPTSSSSKKLAKTEQGLSFFDPAALAEYKRCFRNPATIHAMCEDYRATFGVDLDMDEADFEAGRKIACPVLLLWGATGGVGRNHDSMEIWPRYAADIRGAKALPCGHYLSEEAPERDLCGTACVLCRPEPEVAALGA